jgi:hypothetical protein
MSRKITKSNIYNYLEGNGKFIINKLGLSQPHIKEQVAHRLLVCQDDCVVQGRCKVCTCPLPNRAFSTESCNKALFPDLMNEQDWLRYKQANGIE